MTSVETPTAQLPARQASRRPRTALWAAVAVGLVAVLLIGVLATGRTASSSIAPSVLLGKPAPEIDGPDLNGAPVRLGDLRGRFVVVNFFATWCIPCVREHAELVRFAERPGQQTRVMAVVYDDQLDDVRRFFAERGGSWPVVDDSGAKVDYGVRGVPESFVVGPEGTVRARVVGGVTASKLDAVLADAGSR